MQPIQNLRILAKLKQENNVEPYGWSRYWNFRGFDSLEKRLEGVSGEFAFGDEPTVADIFILPQMLSAKIRFDVELEAYPRLFRAFSNFIVLPEVQKALPQAQPDYVDIEQLLKAQKLDED